MVEASIELSRSTEESEPTNYYSICYEILATYLGHERPALLLQRLHYWLQNEYSGYLLKDGTKWIYNGYREIQEQFPWLSIDQIGRQLRFLEKIGWIISERFHKLNRNIGFITKVPHFQEDNQRKWYRLNYQKIFEDTGFDLLFAEKGESSDKSPKRRKRPRGTNLQNCRLQSAILHNAICKDAESSICKENQNTTKILSLESEKKVWNSQEEDTNYLTPKDLSNFEEIDSTYVEKIELDKSQEQKVSDEGQCSAACDVNQSKTPRRVQQVKPSYYLNGFDSQEERDGFYEALMELGKQKADVRSPVGWACNIIKDINAGGVCEYLNEYRRGQPLGMCEKHEWEFAPSQVYPRFLRFLKVRLKLNQMSGEQAIKAAHSALRDTTQAKEHWESFKRTVVNFAEQWERDKALGLSGAYVPPELLPDAEVAIEEAAQAMQTLQANCIQAIAPVFQPEALPPVSQPEAEASDAEADTKSEIPSAETVAQWREQWNSKVAIVLRPMISRWVEQTNGAVIVTDDGPVLKSEFEKSDADSQSSEQDLINDPWQDEQEQVESMNFQVGDSIFVNTCPHTDALGPFVIQAVEGNLAKVELFEKLVRLCNLRRAEE